MFVIDFEASGLNHLSYPIQVGVCGADSEYSAYIRPEDSWTYWNDDSQDIHNIPRPLLFDIGKPAKQVAEELNEFLGDHVAYCDGGTYDIHWGNALYEATGVERSWRYGNICKYAADAVGAVSIYDASGGVPWHVIKDKLAEQQDLVQHDALNDARMIRQAAILIMNNYL